VVNIQAVDKITETPIDTLLVPEPGLDKTRIAVTKLKFNKFQGIDLISTETSDG
jgi:hypothetical protein